MGKSIKAVVLAGGKGERLLPITKTLPKPMVQVNGKPLLVYILRHLKRYGIKDITLSLCYLPNVTQEYFLTEKSFGVTLNYSIEPIALGTAGAIGILRHAIDTTFIVCSGDVLRELNIAELLHFHKQTRAVGSICVYKNKNEHPKSSITFDRNKIITSFEERPKTNKHAVWSNASFYVFEPTIFQYIPENRQSDFGKDIFPMIIQKGGKLSAFIQNGYLLDVGNSVKLQKAQEDIQKGEIICY